jgi:4-hydroxy-tetrahydrodipicolinate reductase
MIKVAVAGASGRMGSLVSELVMKESDMELVLAIDPSNVGKEVGNVVISPPEELERLLAEREPDVLVDFTRADACVENVKIAVLKGVKLVVGTTGFSDSQREEIRKTIDKSVPAVISPNFSVGVNIFWKLLDFLGKHLPDYDVEIIEAHHSKKKDAPSGTAIKAAEIIKRKTSRDVPVHSIRAGDIVGEHKVICAGHGEKIEIFHQALSRITFASGAIKAIRWVMDAPPGIHSMEEVLGI